MTIDMLHVLRIGTDCNEKWSSLCAFWI